MATMHKSACCTKTAVEPWWVNAANAGLSVAEWATAPYAEFTGACVEIVFVEIRLCDRLKYVCGTYAWPIEGAVSKAVIIESAPRLAVDNSRRDYQTCDADCVTPDQVGRI
jgi:hypothetical protein